MAQTFRSGKPREDLSMYNIKESISNHAVQYTQYSQYWFKEKYKKVICDIRGKIKQQPLISTP